MRRKCFFLFFCLAHFFHYTDMKLHILQYKRKWKGKSIHFGQWDWIREMELVHFFFLFYFRQDVEPGQKGDKKKQNSLQRARVQRDAYFNKSCGFSVSYYKLKSWTVKCQVIDETFFFVFFFLHTSPFLWGLPKLAGWHLKKIDFWTCKKNQKGNSNSVKREGWN